MRVTANASGACSAEIPFAYAKKQFFLLGHLFLSSPPPPWNFRAVLSGHKPSFAFSLCLSYLPAPPLSLGLFALPWRKELPLPTFTQSSHFEHNHGMKGWELVCQTLAMRERKKKKRSKKKNPEKQKVPELSSCSPVGQLSLSYVTLNGQTLPSCWNVRVSPQLES